MSKRYHLGILGFGGMGEYHYLRLQEWEERCVEPMGVFDLNPDRLEVAAQYGLHLYGSAEELLADPAIDAVLVATSNDAHLPLSVAALQAGKHVLCEKPVTLTSDELCTLMQVAQQSGKVFTVDQNRRTDHDFVSLCDQIKQGSLGEVYHIDSHVDGSRGIPSGWRTVKHLGGGMLYDWGVHLIDQMMYLNPLPVTQVYCRLGHLDYADVDDNVELEMTFQDGMTAHIAIGTNNYIPRARWYAAGREGTLQIGYWDCEGKVIRCRDKQNAWDEKIVYTKAGPTKTMAPRRSDSVDCIELHEPTGFLDALPAVYRQWIDAVEGAPLKIKPEQCLRVLRVIEAAFASDEQKQVVHTNI